MVDSTINPILSAIATVGSRVKDLKINDGQLIFVRDKHRIALDFGGKRTFYNQIEELATEEDRTSLLDPVAGLFYFVIETAVLWVYRDGWIQLTTTPKDVIYIGVALPDFGISKTLYVDTNNKEISVWDEQTESYVVVADKTVEMTAEDINILFKNI